MELVINKGDTYGKLTIIKEVERFVQPGGQYQRGFLCLCDCGRKKRVRLSHLRHNRVTSCGCIKGIRHGDFGTHLHNIWRGMSNRVRPNYFERKYYFDKGITLNPIWHQYFYFREWALKNGYSLGLEIDRIDNSRGYYPDNCRFVTREENMANRDCTTMITYRRKEVALMTILRIANKTQHTEAIRGRIKRGWDHTKAVDTPIRKGNYFTGKRK